MLESIIEDDKKKKKYQRGNPTVKLIEDFWYLMLEHLNKCNIPLLKGDLNLLVNLYFCRYDPHNNIFHYMTFRYARNKDGTIVKDNCKKHFYVDIFDIRDSDFIGRIQKDELLWKQASLKKYGAKEYPIKRRIYDLPSDKFENRKEAIGDRNYVKVYSEQTNFHQLLDENYLQEDYDRYCADCEKNSEIRWKGEKAIANWLDNATDIFYKKQAHFSDCINPKTGRQLYFDAYCKDYNILIEFDGNQHYEAKKRFGGINGFKSIQERDKLKNAWANKNKIYLLRIRYNDFKNINKILHKTFRELGWVG
jgi:hypothetical protein